VQDLRLAGSLLEGVMMSDNIVWLDFNDAADPREDLGMDTEALRAALLDRLEAVLQFLFPQERIRGNRFYVGDADGTPGKSLVVELAGPRRGLWKDFATDEGGDVIAVWARAHGQSTRHDFPQIVTEIRQWLGLAPPTPSGVRPARRDVALDELGAYTAKWDYLIVEGELIACVYRFDPPTGKEYRPWDVQARMWRAPGRPRPGAAGQARRPRPAQDGPGGLPGRTAGPYRRPEAQDQEAVPGRRPQVPAGRRGRGGSRLREFAA
jgi:hypothetical protein